ncbi:tripartite tricarboxylate transporter substrate binding protein [Falsirhodobacter halotolerans]|uniref:tripartite tricarboxylate transporter substrate binding protein n=1 Tax=Falsirhodobacter halotolerans TaxID=1146892 RepID=UPI001FD080E7|nr:tripartite tricarboxylate transporter substrate binding protein [Falsirhodobacter halotolerans]MCJ8139869.1 tripartite tricarboxylate transporter substrate binding protein [Falsirhodobacter halotolerans]
MKKRILAAIAAGVSTFAAGAAFAEYPERPITMIVAYSAGGGTDIAARTLAPFIEKHLGGGASIVVVNRPGASGEIGFAELAKASPDGYTIGFINTPNVVTVPIQREARYGLDDLQPIGRVIDDPGAFSVLPSSDIKTLDDLVAYAKENPGAVTYGTTGLGSDDHLAALEFEKVAGVKFSHVPFGGNADVRAATLGGHIMLANMNISETIADVEEGTLHPLGQMAVERWDGAPEIATFREQGYDVVSGSQRGIGAPAGLPEDVAAKLEKAVADAVADPEFRARAEQQKLALDYADGATFAADLQAMHESYSTLWNDSPWMEQ